MTREALLWPLSQIHFSRRRACAALLGLAALPAAAQFRVEISGVGATQLPIAVVRFRDEDKTAQSPSAIIRADLERSGAFRIVDTQTTSFDESARPEMAQWRSRAADALVAGSVTRLADGRYDVRFKLWDVVKGSELGGQSSAVEAGDLRLAAHRIADFIYEKLTGEKGVFSTRIAYVTRSGTRHTLRVADADGENGQVALNSGQPIISPAWSPNGKELAYVSFERQKAVVFVHNVASGERRPIADFRGSNSAPAWAPDGERLAVTLSREGGSQLYSIGRNGGDPRRLASSPAIDTESEYSADGRWLYFTSDRGGSPQIYRMSANGGAAERVTFSGNYNISPAVSPDGRTLAYVTRAGNAFRLAVLDLSTAGAQPQTITDTNDDEHPSFAPNGRLLIYATRAQGRSVLMTTTLDGKIKARLPSQTADLREPVWGPYGR
ncbi:MAG TPA: Tol-Pal system beta propeller repeat protein TolB [Caldimonas sp.]|jgi:TolB protein|nr:Tol-Pal system beta propeller repeat protein TolB [Caldimonas sp.]